ncbi:MAG TPA: PilZ domain-containing protein [Candidatus Acidoferrales bacterium]|nr:PilZ domain-containing protein [Candidatus Acidoferrales bacterium]
MTAAKSGAKPGASKRGAIALAEGRRRSQRVMVRVSLVLHHSASGKPESIPAYTVSVNVHGAMICAAVDLAAEARCEIEHKITKERMSVRVTRKPEDSPEGFMIPVEFENPSADFWRISFPPSDWKPLDF